MGTDNVSGVALTSREAELVEACVLPVYVLVAVPAVLIGLAIVLAVIRADPKDLPAIVRAVMRLGLPDDDGGKGPPSLPRP